jgi:membrane protease YdiL (CAAX protease family)
MADPMKSKPWLAYVTPMAIYLAFLLVQSPGNLLWVYPVKTIAVAAALWTFRKQYEEVRLPWVVGRVPSRGEHARPAASGDAAYNSLAIVVGLVAIAIWIFGDRFYPKVDELMLSFERVLSRWMNTPPPKGTLAAPFDPTTIDPVSVRYAFIGFRVVGAVLVVPVMEELFWRAFLIRWLIDEDFKKVPVGAFTWTSFAITVALFGAEHNQWLAGLICGALYNWLLYRTRSVWACIVAHAVSNAALAAWVLARGDWKFW